MRIIIDFLKSCKFSVNINNYVPCIFYFLYVSFNIYYIYISCGCYIFYLVLF